LLWLSVSAVECQLEPMAKRSYSAMLSLALGLYNMTSADSCRIDLLGKILWRIISGRPNTETRAFLSKLGGFRGRKHLNDNTFGFLQASQLVVPVALHLYLTCTFVVVQYAHRAVWQSGHSLTKILILEEPHEHYSGVNLGFDGISRALSSHLRIATHRHIFFEDAAGSQG
jgi:hypothetical protein